MANARSPSCRQLQLPQAFSSNCVQAHCLIGSGLGPNWTPRLAWSTSGGGRLAGPGSSCVRTHAAAVLCWLLMPAGPADDGMLEDGLHDRCCMGVP